jgi:hypothetical protein
MVAYSTPTRPRIPLWQRPLIYVLVLMTVALDMLAGRLRKFRVNHIRRRNN